MMFLLIAAITPSYPARRWEGEARTGRDRRVAGIGSGLLGPEKERHGRRHGRRLGRTLRLEGHGGRDRFGMTGLTTPVRGIGSRFRNWHHGRHANRKRPMGNMTGSRNAFGESRVRSQRLWRAVDPNRIGVMAQSRGNRPGPEARAARSAAMPRRHSWPMGRRYSRHHKPCG